MQADSSMASEHRLYTTHSGKDRYRSEFALPIGQQVTLEEVSEQVLFKETFDGWSEEGIACLGSIGRCAGYFSKYITTTLVAVSVVRNGGGFPTYGVLMPLTFRSSTTCIKVWMARRLRGNPQ